MKPLRLWPGVVLGIIVALTWFVLPRILGGDASMIALMGGTLGSLLIFLWWLFLSRAPWLERIAVPVVLILALITASRLFHQSILGGMMGYMPWIFGIPGVSLAVVAWAVLIRGLRGGSRLAAGVLTLVIGCGHLAFLRTDGVTGEGVAELKWRWTPTSEEQLLAATIPTVDPRKEPPAAPVTPAAPPIPAWPGFRGPDRDGVVHGVSIDTNWTTSPPVEIWRRSIGPGWSSFAVSGDFLYTQEQRGEDEVVSAYRLSTGEPVWQHRDRVRFWESNGGAGPRGTPTFDRGRIYAFGGTGVVNALDAGTGAVIWSRNAAADTKTDVPGWGFSSSPLVIDDVVIVAAAGNMIGYDVNTGEPRWRGPVHGGSYSSPHRVTVAGATQVVMLSTAGATGVEPATGAVLWEHEWTGGAIVQPAVMADGVLVNSISMTGGQGIRRLALSPGAAAGATPARWSTEEKWTSTGLKPYYNDFVLHKGAAYGFDGTILACIDLADGTRKWKGGRYGAGQLIALADQDVLLVLSEEGDLALVSATPDKFTELARVPAIEGKTWNHPALVGDVLLVRNGEEMAAFRLRVRAR